jgi:lysophospholipase L1-like esterase
VYVGCIETYILSVNDESGNSKLLINNEFVYSDETQAVLQKNMNLMSNGVKSTSGIEFTTGKYVNTSGNEVEIAYTSVTGMIKATNIVAVYTYLTTALTISYYNIDGRFLGYINDTTNNATTKGTPKLYTLNKPVGTEYIRISNVHTRFADSSVYLMVEKDIVYKDYTENVTAESGKYCNTINGTLSAVTYAEVSDFYQIDNIEKVYGSLSANLGLCYYDFDKKFISGINGVTGESPSWRTLDIPSGAYYLRMSNDTRYNAGGIVFQRKSTVDTLSIPQIYALYNRSSDSIANVSKNTDDFLAMYDRIICIGDSLTWSQVYIADYEQRRAFKPYPTVLGSLCGAVSENHATPGDSAVLWWQRSSTGAFENHGLYIVFLGTNGGLTDTIDTDCPGTDPDGFDKTTNTGAYGAILQTISNNGDKAVLITPYAGGGSSISTTKSVIGKFSAKYNFPVIDINTPERLTAEYHLFHDGTGRNNLHFNDLGYAWMANEVNRQINLLSAADKFKIMRAN